MVDKVEVDGELYAILVRREDRIGSEWFAEPIESLQVQRFSYSAGKTFRKHHHLLNPRIIKRTQEAFIVIRGHLAVDIYDKRAVLLKTLEAGPGEAVLIYRGGHGVRVLEDCIVYEVKAGQFSYVSEDKEFLDD